jgi:hypothetical protein
MQINYYIGGIEVEPPINQAEFGIELNYDKDDTSNQAVSLTEFEFGLGSQVDGNDAASLINLHRSNGLSTGVGIFEGLPFKIELTEDNTTEVLFDGYLNTSTALWDCDKVIVNATEKGKIDFLNETADSITFAYLYDEFGDNRRGIKADALITNSDFISVPYVLSSVPDNKEALLALISLAFMVDTIGRELQAITELVASLPNVLEWTAVIRLLLRIIYVAGLIILLVELFKRIVDLLIQPIKYHDVMLVKTLCEKGAAHFGLTFESSILNDSQYADKLVILPKKYLQDVNTTSYGKYGTDALLGTLTPNSSTSRGYYQGTFGQLLRDLKEVVNGKIIIEGNVLRLEKEDYNNSAYNYQVPPVDQTQYSLNAQDLKSNYTVEFLTDINDKNTLQNYEGTLTQVITRPDRITNTDMVLMTGLEQRLIPFARATKKDADTTPEIILKAIAPIFDPIASTIVKIVNAALKVAEVILGQLGEFIIIRMIGVTNYIAVSAILSAAYGTFTSLNPQAIVDLFEDLTGVETGIDFRNLPTIEFNGLEELLKLDERKDMLLMENDMVDIPKLMLIDESTNPVETNINSNNDNIINSEFLYNNFHFLRNFAITEERPHGNQYKIYSATGVPFCWNDYQLLKNSNRLQDSDGREGELISCRWNIEGQTAEIEYKINEAYTNNIEVEIITPDGK